MSFTKQELNSSLKSNPVTTSKSLYTIVKQSALNNKQENLINVNSKIKPLKTCYYKTNSWFSRIISKNKITLDKDFNHITINLFPIAIIVLNMLFQLYFVHLLYLF